MYGSDYVNFLAADTQSSSQKLLKILMFDDELIISWMSKTHHGEDLGRLQCDDDDEWVSEKNIEPTIQLHLLAANKQKLIFIFNGDKARTK